MTAQAKARVDYKGHASHGKTLPVLGRRDVQGIPCLILDHDGVRLAVPAERAALIHPTTTDEGSTP